jgi:hypothetical protein
MTATTTADAGTNADRLLADSSTLHAGAVGGAVAHTTIGANDLIRHALLVAMLLLLAIGGFVTARLTSAPVHEPAARVCSETCSPLSIATRPMQAGRETEEP